MDQLLSTALVILIVIASLGIVIAIGKPAIEASKTADNLKTMENTLNYLSYYIKNVAYEGKGSVRTYSYSSNSELEVVGQEDLIQARIEGNEDFMDYLSRKDEGIVFVSGNDVSCYEESSSLVMENRYLRVVFQKVNGAYSTVSNIISITDKSDNRTIYPVDTSILIDDDPATSSGTGYSRLSRSGQNLPACRAEFFMNSTMDYNIFYKLYAGADFITIDVRNIKPD